MRATLIDAMMHFKNTKGSIQILVLGLIYITLPTKQQGSCRVLRGQFKAKKCVDYISFEGVPAQ